MSVIGANEAQMSAASEAAPPASPLRADTLADSALILLALLFVQRLVGLVRAMFFCRWLSPEVLGQWDMAFGFLMLAGPASVLALSSGLGRYVEHYRRQGRLRTLLVRVAAGCGGLATAAATLLVLMPVAVSQWVFNTPEEPGLALMLAPALVTVVAFNYFVDLFTALRHARALAMLQAASGLLFAALGIGLLVFWQASAKSVIAAYAAANGTAVALGAAWLARHWRLLPEKGPPLAHRQLWGKLVPYTTAIWLGSLLANAFELADRTLIVHYLPGSPSANLALAGQYHSARVLPLLLVSMASVLGPLLTPHMSHDWEAGQREQAGLRLSLFLKLVGLLMLAGGAAVLVAGPVVFHTVFQGKFGAGQQLLPGTLLYCTWFAMLLFVQNYLCCAEKPRLASVALAGALAANVGLNLVLLPAIGLAGAVAARCLANLVGLGLVLGFSYRLGYRPDRGVWIILAAPAAFALGPLATLAVLAGLVFEGVTRDVLFSPREKHLIAASLTRYLGVILPR